MQHIYSLSRRNRSHSVSALCVFISSCSFFLSSPLPSSTLFSSFPRICCMLLSAYSPPYTPALTCLPLPLPQALPPPAPLPLGLSSPQWPQPRAIAPSNSISSHPRGLLPLAALRAAPPTPMAMLSTVARTGSRSLPPRRSRAPQPPPSLRLATASLPPPLPAAAA